jgi:hypothetical protein
MNRDISQLVFSILLLTMPFATWANALPNEQDMTRLRPQPGTRLQLYDRIFSGVADSATEAHQLYSDPDVLADIEQRLARVRESGNTEDILSLEERQSFAKNLQELRALEQAFFERWYLKAPMTAATGIQRWWTARNSPEPRGVDREAFVFRLQETIRNNLLYRSWSQSLPLEFVTPRGPQTWGELLLRFNRQATFRREWVRNHPGSLPRLQELSRIWAWEDSSVRSVTVYDSGTATEHWVLHRQPRVHVPNRFQLTLDGDMDSLVRLEYAPTIFFNRLSRIASDDSTVTYHLEAIEKGRTMELIATVDEAGTRRRTFRGAELLRKSKVDEFVQRDYIQRGSLNLFLGLRTVQLDQIQELFKLNPELVLAVGQFGFSVTGGRAQTVSNRTDSPSQQILKLTATLIDIVEFARTRDVQIWFRRNTQHVLRTIVGGVGAGGEQGLKDPATLNQSSVRLCRELF